MTLPLPTEDNHFQARFHPLIGAAFITVGGLIVVFTLRAMLASGSFSFRLVLGVLLVGIGGLYLKRPYFAIAPNRLTIYNFFGQIVKRYPFIDFRHLEIVDSRVYINAGDTDPATQTKVRKWMTKPSDWKKLKQITGR